MSVHRIYCDNGGTFTVNLEKFLGGGLQAEVYEGIDDNTTE